ncbi:Mitotic apparatus protein [Tritrichomonas foetus]|uniref:Mitotic apparatus protein n=1 Tax=Tritrichomonas foetus TaxID=1144522 RepID=A0A1J4K904_9EUKA|nr:Mitotic apparatus protein [Tritrichomonas foetus]|eukprot:OHT06158.1 Mitotic apparatus protein [Tritrichomonas foetus]
MTTNNPDFERDESHQFKVGESVFVIDPNGFDLWKATIRSIEENKFSLHYPEFPDDDEIVEGTERLLERSRKNGRIFNEQEVRRSSAQENEEEDEVPSDSDSAEHNEYSDVEDAYAPDESGPGRKSGKKNKKGKNNKNNKKPVVKPRPEGARSSPRRKTD